MIVVCDTSPINYLILIGQIEILPQIFGQVFVPKAVFNELQNTDAPIKVRNWLENIPDWLVVKSVPQIEDLMLNELHMGEREAITLAESLQADLILIDEKLGRKIAVKRGLNVVGTVGVIDEAARRNLVDIAAVLKDLRKTNFRISPELINSLIEKHR